MIRKLTEHNRRAVLAYAAQEPCYNVFLTGDIENFGFETEFQEIWGDFGRGGLHAVLLRYYTNNVIYSKDCEFDVAGMMKQLPRTPGDWMLSGKENLVLPMAEALGLDDLKTQFLVELRSRDKLDPEDSCAGLEWACAEDFDEVMRLHREIKEFGRMVGSEGGIRKNVESGTGRTVSARVDGRLVSSASSAAESSNAAMVIGVCTHADYRNRGLATRCVSALCRALLSEGKFPCLFYDNPAAGRIYRRMGFRDAGRWAMASWKGEVQERESNVKGRRS